MNRLAIIQIRGRINSKPEVKTTLDSIKLTRTNHCVIIDDRDTYKGMLQVIRPYVTWGEINQETFEKMFLKRARGPKNCKVDDTYMKTNSDFKSVKEFVEKYFKFEAELNDIKGLKPIFRLSPPSKGFKNTKKFVQNNGSLGYRQEKINDLLRKMI